MWPSNIKYLYVDIYQKEATAFILLNFNQPAGAIANTTTTAAPTQEKQKSPATAPRNKTRGKKGKGKGKAKPEPPEETDPRKLELIRWVRGGFMEKQRRKKTLKM